MSEELIRELVETSDMIVNGYAFNRLGDNVRVMNLNTGDAAVLLPDGTISEASMDDIVSPRDRPRSVRGCCRAVVAF